VPTAFSVAGAAFNVSLSLLLIPRYGIAGAAAVNLIHAAAAVPIFLVYVHRRVLGISLRELLRRTLVRPLAAVAAAWLPMALLLPFAWSLPGLALAFAATLLAFAVLGILVGASDTVDRTRALDVLRRRRATAAPTEVVS
jgi:O-antigen/teichoic acid export membrane protein